MKLNAIYASAFILLAPAASFAQSFDTVDACKSLHQEVSAAIEESNKLDTLLADNTVKLEDYLSQLYDGVKLLSKTGEMFFKASDSHESNCKTALKQTGKSEELADIYDWYLQPVQKAYRFFRRAREAAIALNRQDDVDTFNKTMTEYDAAIMKLVSVCQSDLAGTARESSCAGLSARLTDTLKQ